MFNNHAENNTWREDKIKHDRTTKCKCHKGFRGLRRSEVRFNFSCNLIGNHPQSLTALTLDRYWQVKQNKNQHGLREPKGLPPNVTKRKIKKVETRTH